MSPNTSSPGAICFHQGYSSPKVVPEEEDSDVAPVRQGHLGRDKSMFDGQFLHAVVNSGVYWNRMTQGQGQWILVDLLSSFCERSLGSRELS